eukprot:201847-Prorocentrum_minimum.AAC.1
MAAEATGRGITRSLRDARDRGERKIYMLARNLHWRVLLVDFTRKQLFTFDMPRRVGPENAPGLTVDFKWVPPTNCRPLVGPADQLSTFSGSRRPTVDF